MSETRQLPCLAGSIRLDLHGRCAPRPAVTYHSSVPCSSGERANRLMKYSRTLHEEDKLFPEIDVFQPANRVPRCCV